MALGIGAAVRYLHEECADGPIVNLSVSSEHIVFSHDNYAMVSVILFLRGLKSMNSVNGKNF